MYSSASTSIHIFNNTKKSCILSIFRLALLELYYFLSQNCPLASLYIVITISKAIITLANISQGINRFSITYTEYYTNYMFYNHKKQATAEAITCSSNLRYNYLSIYYLVWLMDYIIPPIPPIGGIGGIAGAFSSTLSATMDSVVSTRAAMEAAF